MALRFNILGRCFVHSMGKTCGRPLGDNSPFRYHEDSAWRVIRTYRLAPVFSIWEPALVVEGVPL